MSSPIKTYVRARSLTECVFDNSLKGRFKHFLWRHALNGERAKMQARRIGSKDDTAQTAAALREAGIAAGAAADFLSADGLASLAAAEEMIRARLASDEVQNIKNAGRTDGQHKDYLILIVNSDEPISGDHPLVRVALDERLLDTVAEYLGMWPQLHAVGAWYNYPVKQEAKASQLWHRDPEDLKTVKVFIYLDDVGPDQGPFTYIPGTHPFGADCDANPRHEHPRRVLDAEMERTIPRNRWLECMGPARTMLIADTVGFHRGGNVKEGHRLLITFTYTSGAPQIKRRLQLVGEPAGPLSTIQDLALKG